MLEVLFDRHFPDCMKVKQMEKVNRDMFVSNEGLASKFLFVNKHSFMDINEFINKKWPGDALNTIILEGS